MLEWTDEHVALLTKRRAEGWSASQIAAEIGEGVTRNAVIGKWHRLELPAPARKAEIVRPTRLQRPAPLIALPPPIPPPEPPITDERAPVPFLRARDGQCRFSIDLFSRPSPDMLVCGAATPVGRSWCPACASRVFSRLDPRTARHRSMTR